MAKKKTVADQSRSGHVSSFTGGLNTDLHPMLQPNDTLTDCVNGTLITYNGNENMLQNDMGNYELKHAQLPEGYIPMGMKEHQGILYIASWNPFEKRAQIGSYPSPKTIFGEENGNEYTISPIEIGEINTESFSDSQLAKLIFNIAENNTKDLPEGVDPSKHLVRDIDLSQTERVFTDNFDENTKLGAGDRYWLSTPDEKFYEDDFQKLEYFLIDKDKNKYDITNSVECSEQEKDSPNADDFVPVTFDHSGWLGARYALKNIDVPDINVTINENSFTSENYLDAINEVAGGISELENIKEMWSTGIPAYQVSTLLSDIPIQDVYPSQSVEISDSKIETTSKFNENNPDNDAYIYVHSVLKDVPEVDHKFIVSRGGVASVTCKFQIDDSFTWDTVTTIFKSSAFVETLGVDIYVSKGVESLELPNMLINKLVVVGSTTEITNPNKIDINTLYCFRNSTCAFSKISPNVIFIDQQTRLFVSIINGGSDTFSFNVSSVVDKNKDCIHQLDVFGTEEYNWASQDQYSSIQMIRINSPVHHIDYLTNQDNIVTFVINNSCPKQVLVSCNNAVNLIIDKNNDFETVKLIKLQGVINAWINGDVRFTHNYPDNLYSSNVYATDDYYFNLTNNNTCVESVVCNANISVDEIVVPEGITSVSAMLFKNHIKTLDLPKTLNKIGSDFYEELAVASDAYDVDNLILRSNFRPSSKGIFTAQNIYVVPNNLYYYNKHRPYSDENTRYFNLSALKESIRQNYELDLKTNSDYTLLSDVFDLLDNPFIITPRGKNLNVPHCDIINGNVIMSFNRVITDLSVSDLPEGLKFSAAKVNADCRIEKGVISDGQDWTVTKNTAVDISNLTIGNVITLNVLGIETIDELNKFVSLITFPELEEGEENNTLKVTINSSAGSVTSDFSKTGITVEFNGGEFNEYDLNETVEFKPSTNSWAYCNITPSFEGELNTYSIYFTGIGDYDYDDALNALTNICGTVLQESVLLLPTTVTWKDIVKSKFKLIVYRGDNENNVQSSNKILANVVLEGNETTEYHQYAWNLVPQLTGKFKILISVLGIKGSTFGIKFRTPLFKYEDGILKIKDFYASLHAIQSCNVSNSNPNANIIASVDSLQDNCKVAIRIKYGDNTMFGILSENQLSMQEILPKSDIYSIDGFAFKHSGDKILIEDLNKKTSNISKQTTTDDLTLYKFGHLGVNKKSTVSGSKIIKVKLEWPQAINHADCYWTISDLNSNIVSFGEIHEDMYLTDMFIDIDCSLIEEGWYVFSYNTPTKKYKRPLFVGTKINYNTDFKGPSCVDYNLAYCDDIMFLSTPSVTYKTENLPLGMTEMQIFCKHEKKEGAKFTWESLNTKESPKALWWELMDNFNDNDTYYLGTRKYQKVTVDFEKLGFVKGVTEYSVELHSADYDKPKILQEYGVYDVNNCQNEFVVPVGECVQEIQSSGRVTTPFKKKYLIQNAYAPMEIDCKSMLSEDKALVVSEVCDWTKGKMLFVDKTSGETNDCSIALLDPTKYDENSDTFDNSQIISGEGNFISKVLSKVNNLFVPIIAQIKSDDNGFVFPVVKNKNWKYKETWDEARGKKNSDNKRSVWSSHGLGAIVHTKNNMAAIISTLVIGFSLLAAAIAEYISAIAIAAGALAASIYTLGASSILVIGAVELALIATAQVAAGLSFVSAGFAEFKKKKKTFKLFALRGKTKTKDILLLPLWGKQLEHETKRRQFDGQVRYENTEWATAEKLMLYLGSRVYAKVFSKEKTIPTFVGDPITRGFKLVIKYKNSDIKAGNGSLKAVEKAFKDVYKITSNNFTLKNSNLNEAVIDFYPDQKFDFVNKWLVQTESDPYSTLEYQLSSWSSNETDGKIVTDGNLDSKIASFVSCLEYDNVNECFYYNEPFAETWYEDDYRWAFGPNRGGCRMRIKRNYRKKNGTISNDKDWIDVGEFPRFNNDVATPIAYPILPYCDYSEGRSENIVNSYDTEADNPVYIETLDLNIEKPEDIITEDCMNYLEYIYYDKIKKLQTTDSTN